MRMGSPCDRFLTQTCAAPPPVLATNAIVAPSGENAASLWEPGKLETRRTPATRNAGFEEGLHQSPAAAATARHAAASFQGNPRPAGTALSGYSNAGA